MSFVFVFDGTVLVDLLCLCLSGSSIAELRRLPYPQVVLASGLGTQCTCFTGTKVPILTQKALLDLDTSSFALDLFAEWTSDYRNHVILTQKARPGCLARKLHDDLIANRYFCTSKATIFFYFCTVPSKQTDEKALHDDLIANRPTMPSARLQLFERVPLGGFS
jgi:hypothetical protein